MNYDPERIKQLKEQYPPGTRIELVSMLDPQALPSGSTGTVWKVDDIGTLQMKWDNGRSLGIVPEEDVFRVLFRPEPEAAEEADMKMGGQSL